MEEEGEMHQLVAWKLERGVRKEIQALHVRSNNSSAPCNARLPVVCQDASLGLRLNDNCNRKMVRAGCGLCGGVEYRQNQRTRKGVHPAPRETGVRGNAPSGGWLCPYLVNFDWVLCW